MSNLDLEKIIFPNDNNTYIIRDAQAHTDLANKANKDGSNIVGPWTMNITGHASQDIASTEKRQPGGVAELDKKGLIITSQLPSSVDEIIEGYYFNNKFYEDVQHTKEITGEASKIYIDLSSNQTYRWSGSTYVEISPSIALGVEHSTAGYGDWTNTAYLHATDADKISAAVASGLYKIAATSEGHIASLTAVTKADITALDIPAQDTTYSQGTGISIDNNNVINHSNSVTAGTAKGDDSKTLTFGGTFTIPSVTYDAQGHITTKGTTTMTMPGNPNTDRYVNSASFAHDSTNDNVKMTLTRAGSDTATVTANIPKVSSSSAGVAPKGASVSSQSQNTKFLREDGTWAKPSYTTNTNTTYTLGTSGNTVTLTPSSGSVQSITVPFATNATNATKATQDASGDVITTTYRKLSNNDFDTVNATEVNAGDLIVTGVGRFTNGLYGDLTGTATKVSNSLKIQLNSGTTEGTNQFTYDGSATKTVNVTKSAIGLGNVDNTADANKNVASANTAGSATKATQDESGNNIKATYAASFSISDHTITLKNKNGVSLGTVTVPDNDHYAWTDITGKPSTFTPSAHTHFSLTTEGDNRTVATTPNDYKNNFIFKGLKAKATIDTPSGDVYSYLIGLRGWSDSSGGDAWELAFNNSGINVRHGATTTWGSWTKLLDSSNYNDYAPTKTGTGASGTWGISVSGNAATATKATQDGSGNVITSTYLPLAGGTVTGMTTFNKTIHSDGGQHLYGGGATNSIWYKITLATNGLTPPSSQKWYMCSLSLDIGGDYNSGAKGRIELSYYIYWSGSAFAATNVYGFASGANMENVEVYYKLTEPFIIYVKTLNQYSSLWVRNVTYRDSAYTFRTLETKVETSSAITVENYTAIPISRLYTSNGTYLTTNSSLVPKTNNELYLGSSNSKWSYVYATKFIGALQGNADTATSATTASKLGTSNVGSATQPIYLASGTATACTYTLGKSVPSDAVFTDTKNTAGSTDTSSKIYLIGATSQAANPQTYSHDTAYVGTDGCLYSGGVKVLTAHQDISGKVSKTGDTMSGNLNLKATYVDASQTNNGVSSIQYPTSFHILDNEDRTLARMEAVINPNGNIGSYWYVKNYNTSGGQVAQKGIAMYMNKSGALSYSVSDGEAFATAIGKYTRSSVGTLDWGSTNQQLLMTKSSMAFWNGAYSGTASNLQYCDRGRFGTIVTKGSGDYLPITGGTMTGGINWNGSSGYTNGLYWKESGYGDQFKIYPIFSGADDNNALVIATAAGGAGTTPALTNRFFFRPSGYLDLTNRIRWNTKQEIYNNDVYMILGTSNMVCVRTYNNINAAKPIQAASFQTYSSRLIKKNITDITQDEAKSLLNLRVVDFDYIEQVGGQTNQTGIIAEEALTVYPKCVDIPENYNEDEVKKAIETGGAINAINVDYTKLIAPLIKLVQIQQKEIDDLKAAIKTS